MNNYTETEVDKLPDCDLCAFEGVKRDALYEARLRNLQWSYVCEDHFQWQSCSLGLGLGQELILQDWRYKQKSTSQPSIEELSDMVNSGVARATDGCEVEPDGTCPHGKNSWLIEMDMI